MKYISLFLIFIIISNATTSLNKNQTHFENFQYEAKIRNSIYDVNDSAHFKYYENSSHILHWYEWWYANVKNDEKSIITMFFTFGNLNNPLMSIVGVFVAILEENESIEMITCYPLIEYNLDYEKCNVSIAGNRFYEENGKFVIEYMKGEMRILMNISSCGKPFGSVASTGEWQWAGWYVAVPYGKGKAIVNCKGEKYEIKGNAYHDHNWGISRKGYFTWDWGEFAVDNGTIIYGVAGEDEMKGGIHFVNKTKHIFIPYGKLKIDYIEWKRISGFKKPTKLHLYGKDKNIDIDMYVEMEKAYIIGYKKIGKPYLFGRAYGTLNIDGKMIPINSKGFYEHHRGIKIFNQ